MGGGAFIVAQRGTVYVTPGPYLPIAKRYARIARNRSKSKPDRQGMRSRMRRFLHASQPPIQCHALSGVSGWNRIPCIWACSHHALGRATQQIQDGDDGQPAGAASASSVEGVRRGRSDIWPYPMARSASPAASAHVGKPLDSSSLGV